ncbi:MAG: EAL domain-containing protein [Candidatus Eiseniibacteriota bacterium]
MSYFGHTLLIILYAAAATAAAKYVPERLPEFSDGIPVAIGAFTLFILMLVRGAYLTAEFRIKTSRELKRMREEYGDVMRELGFARAEARQIHDALDGFRMPAEERRRLQEAANEVKVLRGLIDKLGGAHAPAKPKPAAVEIPAEPVRLVAAGGAPVRRPMPMPAPIACPLDDGAVLDIVRDALELDRVDLYLQPIVSLPQRKHRYYECFSRIRDAHGSVVLPEQYIPIATRAGLVRAIDNVLLFRCVQLVRRVQRRQRNVGFFCNMSAHTLSDNEFFREFLEFLDENSDLARNLVFEFVQSDIADLASAGAANLHKLGDLGFRFSLDRIGRLDLNYQELSRRYFRFIKVEAPTLLAHLGANGPEAMRGFKRTLDSVAIDIIVEKIEDEKALKNLLDYNIDFGQGFLFGEPRPAREI